MTGSARRNNDETASSYERSAILGEVRSADAGTAAETQAERRYSLEQNFLAYLGRRTDPAIETAREVRGATREAIRAFESSLKNVRASGHQVRRTRTLYAGGFAFPPLEEVPSPHQAVAVPDGALQGRE